MNETICFIDFLEDSDEKETPRSAPTIEDDDDDDWDDDDDDD